MPTTTRGIRYPSGTDPVDIPTDLGNLAIDVDALIGTTAMTTKGDLLSYSTTEARLPVGTDGQYLTALSSATTGLQWQTITATDTTLVDIASETKTTWTDSAFTFSSIPAGYTDLEIYVQANVRPTTLAAADSNAILTMSINSTSITFIGLGQTNSDGTGTITGELKQRAATTGIFGMYERDGTPRTSAGHFKIHIPNYSSTTYHKTIGVFNASSNSTSGGDRFAGIWVGSYDATTAISAISFGFTAGAGAVAPTYFGIGSNVVIRGRKRLGL